MQFFGKLDMFRVVQDRDAHLTPQTKSGAIISAVCAFLIVMLAGNEIIRHFRTDLHSTLIVAENSFGTELVLFNISFQNTHCGWVVFQAFNPETGGEETAVQRTVKMEKTRLLKGTTVQLGRYTENQGEVNRFATDEGCQVHGEFYINRVPGNFLIASKGQGHGPADADHIIHTLRFGDMHTKIPEVMKRFSPTADVSLFSTLEGTTRHSDDADMIYQYYIQIIPTYLKETKYAKNSLGLAYQYTVQESAISAPGVPSGIYVRHSHSSVAVEYYYIRDSWSHFIIWVCAIVGGVFTVSGFFVPAIELAKKLLERYQGHGVGGHPVAKTN